ncbi:hypothetical protein HHK36_020576 [Tetracentron sinense]|uniref:PGG domain-containing protein n=1 Tax=Tetracentron sinense TaxID=13715 RepID=A0A835D852_TETSI|nr:hypothetical protein HHK36_020576 [Tetracentron sinense]
MASESHEMDTIRKRLFKDAMEGNWEAVVITYDEMKPKAQEAKITRSGDTALHVAVSDGRVDIVERLVEKIPEVQVSNILNMGNEKGNTPLHLAAAIGKVEMCKCLAKRNPNLIDARNKEKETPLFVAVRHGKKEAFLYLHSLHSKCHSGLAFQIVGLYEDLANSRNETGLTPLHILARKPSAFESGTRLGWFDSIIYRCTFVDQLINQDTYQENSRDEKEPKYPENYRTCVNFFRCLKTLIGALGVNSNCASEGESSHSKPRSSRGGNQSDVEKQNPASSTKVSSTQPRLIPPNYVTCFNFFKFVMKALLVVLGVGFENIRKIQQKRQTHTWAKHIMEELVERASNLDYENDGLNPQKPLQHEDGDGPPSPSLNSQKLGKEVIAERKGNEQTPSKEEQMIEILKKLMDKLDVANKPRINEEPPINEDTPILIAAMMGVTEIVEKILEKIPVAIQDENSNGKNIVLLAVENRQPHIYELLVGKMILKKEIFYKVDSEGNSALHLAATLGARRPWHIPGAALQMQWEIKWYKFVKESMPAYFFAHHNKKYKTPKEVFAETHQNLVKDGGKWLTNTSESCSVVAALIATVAFATAATVPGGVKPENGLPTLENHPAFDVFALSSLIALCFSVTAMIMFLSILTSRYEEKDYEIDLPKKLIVGLTSLFIAIAAMLVSFSAGHFIFLKDKLKLATYPVYAVTCLPVTLFAIAQFPLYFDLFRATYKKVPQRSYKVIPV